MARFSHRFSSVSMENSQQISIEFRKADGVSDSGDIICIDIKP